MPHIHRDETGQALLICLDDGASMPVHPLWLRERCQDSMSQDKATGQRLYNPSDLGDIPQIVRIDEPSADGFEVLFLDGACGRFTKMDLLAELVGDRDQSIPSPLPWDASRLAPHAFDWRESDSDRQILEILRAFLADGYVHLSHVTPIDSAVLGVARRFGFIRETNFGALFDVQSVLQASDLAYTSYALDPHTDNPYRDPVPGIQLLHCLVNETGGGLSTLVDGLAVAEALRHDNHDAFDALARTKLRFRYADPDTDLVAEAPILSLDSEGRFVAIRYSPRLDFVPLLPFAELNRYYAARRLLDRLLRSSRFERRFTLQRGELIMFDNRRLLHGRTGFKAESGRRHLQGCYIDADGPRSLCRVLSRRLA